MPPINNPAKEDEPREKQTEEGEQKDYMVIEDLKSDANFRMEITVDGSKYMDFLFGLLLNEIGKLNSGSHFWETLRMTFSRMGLTNNRKVFRFNLSLQRTYQRHFSRYSRIMADSMAPMHGGYHHMLQYLYLLGSNDSDCLTSNGSGEELDQMSVKIRSNLDKVTSTNDDHLKNNASVSNRIKWLQLYRGRVEKEKKKQTRRQLVVKSMVAVFVGIGLIIYVKHSVDYSQIYLDRIADQKKKMEERRQQLEKKKDLRKRKS